MSKSEDNFLLTSTKYGDTIIVGLKDIPEAELSLQWDGADGWNIYRNDVLLLNIPFVDKENKVT